MTEADYYVAPPEPIFEEIKAAAIKIWEGYDDKGGYRTEKLNRIKDLANISDNAWYIVAMFDMGNQNKLMSMVSVDAANMIRDARGYGQVYL